MKRISALTLTLCLCAGLFAPAQTAGADPLPDGSRSAVLDQGTAPARIAYASIQTVEVDGEPVVFETYALRDTNSSETNYIKLRDLTGVLNGTHAQFQVNWFGYVSLSTGAPYTPNGTEMHPPYTGDRPPIGRSPPAPWWTALRRRSPPSCSPTIPATATPITSFGTWGRR